MTNPRRPDRRGRTGPLRPIAWDRDAHFSSSVPKPPETDAFAAVVRTALAQPSAFELVLLASQVIEQSTPRPSDVLTGRRLPPDALSVLCRGFAESGSTELCALALAIAAIHPDEDAAARLRTEVPPRVLHRGPDWLGWIDRLEPSEVVVNVHPLHDGDNAMISWRWPDRAIGTVSVYIDHNMGTIVKDAYAVAESLETIIDIAQEHQDDPYITFIAAKPADVGPASPKRSSTTTGSPNRSSPTTGRPADHSSSGSFAGSPKAASPTAVGTGPSMSGDSSRTISLPRPTRWCPPGSPTPSSTASPSCSSISAAITDSATRCG